MPRTIKRFISDTGEVLLPVNTDADNITDLISTKGKYYKSFVTSTYDEGNSLGLLLALTYTEYVAPPATAVGNPLGLLLSLTYAE